MQLERTLTARVGYVASEQGDSFYQSINILRLLLLQPHLRKCFGNIHQLGIVRQAHSPAQIQHMTSEEGESVLLPK